LFFLLYQVPALYHCRYELRADEHVDEHAHDVVGHRDEWTGGNGWVDFELLEHDGHKGAENRCEKHHRE